jgi:hypothetical protein
MFNLEDFKDKVVVFMLSFKFFTGTFLFLK